MSILGFLKNNKSDSNIGILQEIDSWISYYKSEFYKEYEEDDYSKAIFDKSRVLIISLPEKKILRTLRKNKITLEHMTLNAIQNISMEIVMNGDLREVIKQNGKTYSAIEVYNFINSKKMELRYITPKQFEDNAKLIDDIKCRLF